MFPYKTSFVLKKNTNQSLYLQLANQFIFYISEGKLSNGTKLLGTRTLSDLLGVHRKTVVTCYEELEEQGWVISVPKKGTFVKDDLPILNQQEFIGLNKEKNNNISSDYTFYKDSLLPEKEPLKSEDWIRINDGVSDTRLAPTVEIGRIYRRISSRKNIFKDISYGSTYGNERLREVLVEYLNSSRGLKITKDNLLITRGSQMGIWLSAQLLLKKEDIIVVGMTNYSSADITFKQTQATLKRVAVDSEGIVVSEIEEICKSSVIKAVYITSHHHHPTTVTLSAERRLHLLNLARKYRFAIVEDDYDYDFNYNHAPILPLASHDDRKNVIYIGSVCKTVAPVFRIGYLIASEAFVKEASKHRGYVDRQGDAILELTFAEFIKSGDLDRHIRKILKIYKERRDLFCSLLKSQLSKYLEFNVPKGGMAIWVKLNSEYTWEEVKAEGLNHNFSLGEWERYDMANKRHNAIRMGFASYTNEEIYQLIEKLGGIFSNLERSKK
ncbi:GntR family transcriptional regulator / MocR family aminotransferase [Tenacibaculum sp. MAR_2009_124]|uniref:aminotransferase-like domain-containing protein n=1 Tax=Tenacibaculum sp. MAR_2009_124 TaxID=1250059 RepID=UPI0008954B63|nr:PLP-dependent aminotransferase family protein [Tenacibaculum sp. MAR_2009_124]SEB43475.1 GntR family transcriptional regulator / MocR family aminotransferase [Tenacibaculum sp. MAR_2009_124]